MPVNRRVSSYITICAIVIPSITTFIRGVIILFYPLHGERLKKLEKDLNEINVKDGKYKIPEKDSAQETIVTTVDPKSTAQKPSYQVLMHEYSHTHTHTHNINLHKKTRVHILTKLYWCVP